MRRSAKWFIIALTSASILLIPRSTLNGCGFLFTTESFRFWLFQPDLVNLSTLLPFTFTTNFYYVPGSEDSDTEYADFYGAPKDTFYYNYNIEEWGRACGKNARPEDIRAVLYGIDSKQFFAQFPNGLGENSFIRTLQEPENKPLLDYLMYAKKCEAAINIPDPWGDSKTDRKLLSQALREGEQLHKKATSDFLRVRTAYQMLKMASYLNDSTEVIRIYDKEIEPIKTSSWIKGSAIFYKATMVKGYQGEYLLSRAFDMSPDKRMRSVQLFSDKDLKPILAFAKNNHEKAVILTMKCLRNPGRALGQMKEIYALDPSYSDFGILIEREINKLEHWIMTEPLTGMPPVLSPEYFPGYYNWEDNKDKIHNWASDMLYLADVKSFIEQIIIDGKQKDLPFLHLAAGYLSFIKRDYDVAEKHLAAAEATPDMPANVALQVKLTRMLNDVFSHPHTSPEGEQHILDFITYFDQHKQAVRTYKTFRSQLMLLLAGKFMEYGEIGKGFLLLSKSDRAIGAYTESWNEKNCYHKLMEVARPADYDALLALLEKEKKTPFEAFLVSNPRHYTANYTMQYIYNDSTQQSTVIDLRAGQGWDLNKIKDYKAAWYMRLDQVDSALIVLNTIPDTYWEEEPYHTYMNCNALYLNYNSSHRPQKADSIHYNKRTFVQKIVDLKKDAAANPARSAQDYYLLGNAYYNMSWYGNFWLMTQITWSTNEIGGYGETPPVLNEHNNWYYGCNRAQEYYLRSMRTASDKNLASLACVMVGVCEKNDRLYQFLAAGNNYEKYKAHKNPYASELSKLQKDASVYRKLRESCAMFVDFLEKYSN